MSGNASSSYILVAQEAGLRVEINGPWATVGNTERVQGWKLHLSSIPLEAVSLLERVTPMLSDEGVSFKFARDRSLLGSLNEGSLGDFQVGKFMTVYPTSDTHALDLAKRLAKATSGFHGPVIVTDLRLGDVVYARYGSFRPLIVQDRLGQLHPAIYNNDGTLRPDGYTAPFELPDGISNPFEEMINSTSSEARPRESAEGGRSRRLFGPGYLILGVVKSHPKGSVFLALDLRDQQSVHLCVLKQGRQYCLSDDLGRDTRSRLQHQERMSNLLQSYIPTPVAGDYFEVSGHGYLPLEYIDGSSLLETASTAAENCSWSDIPESRRVQLLDHLSRLAECLSSLHAAGFVHRDVSPTNVLVGRDLKVFLIDLELAHTIGASHPYGKGTPGYMSPEQEAGADPLPSQDVFSFGCIVAFILCGVDPRHVTTDEKQELIERLDILSGGADRGLIELTARCLSRSADSRPSMSDVCSTLKQVSAASIDSPVRVSRRHRFLYGNSRIEESISAGIRGLLADTLRDEESGLWLSSSGDRDSASGASRSFELRRDTHHGAAGVVYALARLARCGYVERETVRPHLMTAVKWLLEDELSGHAELPGLYFGDAGLAVALLEANSSGFDVGVDSICSYIRRSLDSPIDWLDLTHGAAGQGVAAMLCETVFPQAADHARRLARHLVEMQEEDGSWRVPPGVDGLSGQTVSGFAHGCAGIVYFLAACSTRYGIESAEDASRRGAKWLASVAKTMGDSLEWAYSDSLAERWRWWCHGSPGIALAFLRLFKETGDGSFADIAERALDVHVEEARSANLSVCHGLTGLGEIYLDAAAILGDKKWRMRAEGVASTLISLARRNNTGNLTWHVEDPYNPTADLMVGTSGVLHFLARFHSEDQSLGFPLLLP